MTSAAKSLRAARRRRKEGEHAAIKASSIVVAYFANMKGGRSAGATHRRRIRRTVKEIYMSLGPIYFRRAYRMSYASFCTLHSILKDGIKLAIKSTSYYQPKGGRKGGKFKLPPIPNGAVSTSVRLACALRYYSGGSPYDLMGKYGVSHSLIFDSVWHVVEVINNHPDFAIVYPSCHSQQEAIARAFEAVSAVPFRNCAGAIDGVLIWTNKPTEDDAFAADVGQAKFFCGRKHKFGLNCQAVSDVRGRILDISITTGAATSDCLAFEGSKLFQRLEGGLLKPGLVIFADNAYLNTSYMASPYPNATSTRDAYNFYQSQLRIRVECCFGMLCMRWGILRMAMPQNISLVKTIGMVMALAKLHNFCIGETTTATMQSEMWTYGDENRLRRDSVYMRNEGCVPMDSSTNNSHGIPVPTQLMDIGNNPEDLPTCILRQDVSRNALRREERDEAGNVLPRRVVHDQVNELGLQRPATNFRR